DEQVQMKRIDFRICLSGEEPPDLINGEMNNPIKTVRQTQRRSIKENVCTAIKQGEESSSSFFLYLLLSPLFSPSLSHSIAPLSTLLIHCNVNISSTSSHHQ
ncbi:hypothetical protein STEG23_029042, partial [Scotinomys teguina]